MDIKELKNLLVEEEFDPSAYCIYCDDHDEKYCLILHKERKQWEVFYSERGTKADLVEFFDENEACEYFLNYIRDSVTARM